MQSSLVSSVVDTDHPEMFDFDLMKMNIEHEHKLQKEKEAREAKTVGPTPVHKKNDKKKTEGRQRSLEDQLDDLCKGRNQIQMSRPGRPTAAKQRLQAQILNSIAIVKKAGAAHLANAGRELTEMQIIMLKAKERAKEREQRLEMEKGQIDEYLMT